MNSDHSAPKSDSSFTDEVAKFYQSTLVPLIFEDYAMDLAMRATKLKPSAVLEIACGTGVLTRALAAELSEDCEISAMDLNHGMIHHAESIHKGRSVRWQQADVMELPYESAQFDVVLCQFSSMFFADRVAAYQEIRRVLRPGGHFLLNIWNSIEQNQIANIVSNTVANLYPENPPLFLARTPYEHGCTLEIERELKEAGFTECEFTQLAKMSKAESAHHAAIAFCQGTPLRNEIESRDSSGLEAATKACEVAIAKEFSGREIETSLSAVVVEACL